MEFHIVKRDHCPLWKKCCLYAGAVALALIMGGVLLMAAFRPWTMEVRMDLMTAVGILMTVLVGSVFAFTAYMEGVRCVGPKKGSLYASIEPVSAAVFSFLLMGARFEAMDLAGFACILSTIFLLAIDKKE